MYRHYLKHSFLGFTALDSLLSFPDQFCLSLPACFVYLTEKRERVPVV